MKNNTQIKNNHNFERDRELVLHQQRTITFSGPLPHPEVLKMYNEIIPGAAQRILQMAEDQSLHRRELEKVVINSDIRRSRAGQILGFIIAIIGLFVSFGIAVFGNVIAGTVVGASTIVSLVFVFMYGSKMRIKERNEKSGE